MPSVRPGSEAITQCWRRWIRDVQAKQLIIPPANSVQPLMSVVGVPETYATLQNPLLAHCNIILVSGRIARNRLAPRRILRTSSTAPWTPCETVCAAGGAYPGGDEPIRVKPAVCGLGSGARSRRRADRHIVTCKSNGVRVLLLRD